MTIGRDGGNSCGYSDGSIYAPAFGAVSEPSPVTTIFGIWNATDSNCDIDLVYSQNEGWLDDQAMIVGTISGTAFSCSLGTRGHLSGQSVKRITSCSALEDLALGDITINFLTADATAAALLDGRRDDPSRGPVRKVGTLPPITTSAPSRNRTGAAWEASRAAIRRRRTTAGRSALTTRGAPASLRRGRPDHRRARDHGHGRVLVRLLAGSQQQHHRVQQHRRERRVQVVYGRGPLFQIQGTRAQGSITVSGTASTAIPEGTLFDRDGVSTTLVRTLADATIGAGGTVTIAVEAVSPGLTGNNIPPTATFTLEDPITGVNDSAIIQTGFTGGTGSGLVGAFWETIWTYIATIDDGDSATDQALHESLRDNSVFLGEFSQTQDAAEDRDGFTEDTDRYFYLIHGEEDHIQEITGFTDGETITEAIHEWRGPVVTIEDVHDVFEVNSDETVTDVFDNLRVGDNVYTSIVRPDESTGVLRDPTEADWDAADGISRSIAWNGTGFLKAERYLQGSHSADAVFTEVPLLATFTFGGETFRWRGENASSSPNLSDLQDNDFYFWPTRLNFQRWLAGERRWQLIDGTGLNLWEAVNYAGYGVSQDQALGHIRTDGQRVVYHRGPSGRGEKC